MPQRNQIRFLPHEFCLKNLHVVVVFSFFFSTNIVQAQDRNLVLIDAMAVARAMFAEGVIGQPHDQAGYTTLLPCSDTWPSVSHNGVERMWDGHQTLEDRIVSIATDVEEARIALQRSGYPDHVFDSRLDEIAFSLVEQLGGNNWTEDWLLLSSELSTLVPEIEQYRLSQNVNLPRISMGRGCGDGGLVGMVRTEPPGGSVWFASEFDFRLCARRGEDNMSLNGCGWSQENLTDFTVLGGNYRIFAQWPDGATVFTSIDVLNSGTNPLYGQYDPILGRENYADVLITVNQQ